MKICIMALEDELLVSLNLVLSLAPPNLRHIHTTTVIVSII